MVPVQGMKGLFMVVAIMVGFIGVMAAVATAVSP